MTEERIEAVIARRRLRYITQERAFAPGIADGWPDVIPAPHTPNGRLVKRQFPRRCGYDHD